MKPSWNMGNIMQVSDEEEATVSVEPLPPLQVVLQMIERNSLVEIKELKKNNIAAPFTSFGI